MIIRFIMLSYPSTLTITKVKYDNKNGICHTIYITILHMSFSKHPQSDLKMKSLIANLIQKHNDIYPPINLQIVTKVYPAVIPNII